MFVARFNQKECFLPQPLVLTEKLNILRKNILPHYQDKMRDKRIQNGNELIEYCELLDKTRLSIAKFVDKTDRCDRTTVWKTGLKCYRCQGSGHMARDCQKTSLKCFKCGSKNVTTRNCPRCMSKNAEWE